MAIIKKLNGHTPKFGKNCFLADNAAIIGDVEIAVSGSALCYAAMYTPSGSVIKSIYKTMPPSTPLIKNRRQTSEIMSLSHIMPSFTGVRSKTMS